MMAPGTEVRPPKITTGKARNATVASEKLHAQLAAPNHAGHQSHHTGHTPHNDPDAVQVECQSIAPLGGRRPPRAKRVPVAVFWKNNDSNDHQQSGDQRGNTSLLG
jgi:hypothetical protein